MRHTVLSQKSVDKGVCGALARSTQHAERISTKLGVVQVAASSRLPMLNAPRFTPTGLLPTEEQVEIQISRARTVLIEANAGAAKTTTLALRIGEALGRKLPPEEILVLAFTLEAKDVMARRLREIGIPPSIASQVRVATFESFAAEILEKLEGYQPKKISNPSGLKPHVLKAVERVGNGYDGRYEDLEIATHNIAISQFLNTQLSMKATMSALKDFEGMDNEEAADTIDVPLIHFLTFREYEKQRRGSFDEPEFRGPFDATYDLARWLEESHQTISAFPSFRLVLCDELHDLNEASFRILKALLVSGDSYFVGAGDKDQVIYETLGAHGQYLSYRFNEYDPKLVRLPLTATFRHGPHLALAVGKFKQKVSDSPLALKTEIKQLAYAAEDNRKCADLVTKTILDWKENFPSGTCAILLRDRHQSIHVENALMHSDIGYQSLQMQGYLHRDEILFLRGMIAIALKNLASVQSIETRKAIVDALAIFGEVNLTPNELEKAKKIIADDPETLKWFFTGQLLESKSKVRHQISEVVEFVQALSPNEKAEHALREICKKINLEFLVKRIYVFPYEVTVVARSIQGFISSAAASGKSLREFSEWIGGTEASLSRKKKAHLVTLECIANVKGMEFDHVILPFLEEGEFPDPSSNYAGEENLFYVGVTRAKHRLTMITTAEANRQSPFVGRMSFKSVAVKANLKIEKANPTAYRTDLDVPFSSKDEVKALGAKWDPVRRVWFIEPGVDLGLFQRWMRQR